LKSVLSVTGRKGRRKGRKFSYSIITVASMSRLMYLPYVAPKNPATLHVVLIILDSKV